MSRYINSLPIEKELEERFNYFFNKSQTKVLGGYRIDEEMQTAALLTKDCLDRLREAPTAEVAPVRHGEWVYHECVSTYDGCKSGYSCSVCNAFVNEEVFDTDEFHKAFCGNCGAKIKMEGGYPLVCIAEDTMPVPGNCPALEAMVKRVIGSERIVEPNKEELLELMEELKYERRT